MAQENILDGLVTVRRADGTVVTMPRSEVDAEIKAALEPKPVGQTGVIPALKRSFDPSGLMEMIGVPEVAQQPQSVVGRALPGFLPDYPGAITIASRFAQAIPQIFNELAFRRPGLAGERAMQGIGQSIESFRGGDLASGLERLVNVFGTDIPASIPIIGPIVEDLTNRIRSGDVSGGLTEIASLFSPGFLSKLGPFFLRGAQKSASRALQGVTTVESKVIQEINRDAAKRLRVVKNPTEFVGFVDNKLNSADSALNTAIQRAGPKSSFNLQPVIDDLQRKRQGFIVGERPPLAGIPTTAEAVKNLDSAISDLKELQTRGPTLEEVIRLRRDLDKSVNFDVPTSDVASTSVQLTRRMEADRLRREINSQFPEIEQANNNSSFWIDVSKLAQGRLDRATIQLVMANITRFESVVEGTLIGGAAGGLTSALGAPAGIAGATGMVAFGGSQVVKESIAYQTIATRAKQAIGGALSNNNVQMALDAIVMYEILNMARHAQTNQTPRPGLQAPSPGLASRPWQTTPIPVAPQ